MANAKRKDRPRQMKNKPSIESLSPGQAQYVLTKLAEDRRIRQSDISSYLSRMDREIRELEERLGMLKDARQGTAAEAPAPTTASRRRRRSRKSAAAGPTPARRTRKRASKSKLSPETRASRALQGRYISLIKQMPENQRDKYKALVKKKGREEAIRRMEAALGK